MSRSLLAACMALPALLHAQSEKSKTGRYEGSVISTSGGPVADTRVIVQNERGGTAAQLYAVSGLDGRFAFPSLEPSTYSVRVIRPGYVLVTEKSRFTVPGDSLVASQSRRFKLDPDEVVKEKLTLAPESVISGRVVDADGVPIEFAEVQVMKAAKFQAGRMTNDRGEFRITGLLPGAYVVRAKPNAADFPPEIRSDGTREQQDIPTYYPGSTTLEGATRVEAPEGGTATGIEIRLARAPAVQVSGILLGLEGKSYPNFYLLQGSERSSKQPKRKENKFSFSRLSPGKYSVVVTAYDGGRVKSASVPIELEVTDRDIKDLEIKLEPVVDVEGHIQWEDDKEGAGVKLRSVELYSPVKAMTGGLFTSIDPKNSFRLKDVARDRYPVTVFGDQGSVAIKSIQMNGADLPGRILDLTQTVGPITVVLTTEASEISGKADNARPYAVVALMGEYGAGTGRFRYARIDDAGIYSFKRVPLGDYKIALIDEQDFNELANSGTLGAYEPSARTVAIRSKEAVTIDLK